MEINKGLTNRFVPKNIKMTRDAEVSKLLDLNKSENLSEASKSVEKDFSLEVLKDILSSLNSTSEKQTLTLANNLLINSLPITKENLQILNQSLKLFESEGIEKGIFFLKNDLKPSQNLANQLDMYIAKDIKISNQLINTLSNMSNIKNLDEVIRILTNSQKLEQQFLNIEEELTNLNANLLENLKNTSSLETENVDTTSKSLDINNLTTEIIDNINQNENLNTSNISNNLKTLINNLTSNKILFESSDFLKELSVVIKEDVALEDISKNIDLFLKKLPIEKQVEALKGDINLEYQDNFINLKNETLVLNNLLNLDTENLTSEANILKNFLNLLKENPNLKNETIQVIKKVQEFNYNLKEKLSFKIEDSRTEDLNEFFSNLKENINTLKAKIQQEQDFLDNNSEALKSLDNINKNIDFMSYMKNNLYFQIPLNINYENKTAELYVFKDGKNTRKSKGENGSALLSLDLANLGHIETFINKNSKNVSIQFRITNENTKKLIKENLPLLESYMSQKNLLISSIQFKELTESFSVISDIKHTDKPISISSFSTQA